MKRPYPKDAQPNKKLLSVPSLCTFLKNIYLGAQFSIDVSLYKPEMLILIDETGSDCRNRLRRYGYSIRGKPVGTW